MNIPPVWFKVSCDCRDRRGRSFELTAWGWGTDQTHAQMDAAGKLDRLIARVRAGEPFPDHYGYGTRPLREEILETIPDDKAPEPVAIITRNRYGAQVLNTARLLFLDVDVSVPRPTFGRRLRGLFGAGGGVSLDSAVQGALDALREALRRYGGASFRVYRTAAGLRAIAVDREFDPAGREAKDLMTATGTDPAFARLCAAQNSFRARLTPKPWRLKVPLPPGQHPRQDDQMKRQFAEWLARYERASSNHAVCRYIESIGTASPGPAARRLIELHDRLTRCTEQMPLA
ncbi:MAG: hypothetical protein Kow0059_13630 [Candidatus Sumerlaeia bacterium]